MEGLDMKPDPQLWYGKRVLTLVTPLRAHGYLSTLVNGAKVYGVSLPPGLITL